MASHFSHQPLGDECPGPEQRRNSFKTRCVPPTPLWAPTPLCGPYPTGGPYPALWPLPRSVAPITLCGPYPSVWPLPLCTMVRYRRQVLPMGYSAWWRWEQVLGSKHTLWRFNVVFSREWHQGMGWADELNFARVPRSIFGETIIFQHWRLWPI